MRLTFFSLFIICTALVSRKHNKSQQKELNGTWIPVREVLAGTPLVAAAFEKQQLIIKDSNYAVTAESVDKGIIKTNGNKMDIYGKDGVNAGKHFTAIFENKNDELMICYDLNGAGYPEAFDTKGKATYFLAVYKRQSMQ
jgi:uncharacterized protein (TIGR03067 family)